MRLGGLLELYDPNFLFINLNGSNFLSHCLRHPPSQAERARGSLGPRARSTF